MSMYVPLEKAPSSPEERQHLLSLYDGKEEQQSMMETSHVRQRTVEFLACKKQYRGEDIETDVVFSIELPDTAFDVRADIILRTNGKRSMLIKCVTNSIESWERQSLAFGRVTGMPFAAVTDGENAKILDVAGGDVIAEGLDSVPPKEKAGDFFGQHVSRSWPQDRIEREKRVLHAFNSINCSTTISDTE